MVTLKTRNQQTLIRNVKQKGEGARYTKISVPVSSVTFKRFYQPVLWIRNYFFRIRIPFSAEFWIRIPKTIVSDPDPTSKKFRIQFRI
jgi:hypothetical protein